MSTSTSISCNDVAATPNPNRALAEAGRAHTRRAGNFALLDVANPIPAEITDGEMMRGVWNKWKLVPFAGTQDYTGDALLGFYLLLAQRSPTHGAAISRLVKYAVGGRAIFERSTDPEFDLQEEAQPLTGAEKSAYRQALAQYVAFDGGLLDLAHRLHWQYKATGNAWLELRIARVQGQARASIVFHKTSTVRYRKPDKPGEMRTAAVSPSWEPDYLQKTPPRYLPLYPNFVRDEKGVECALFHLKSGHGETVWYGRPDSEEAAMSAFNEVQNEIYLLKQAKNNFTGQLIIEVEEDDPENNPALDDEGAKKSGYASYAAQFDDNYTNAGANPRTVLLASRPVGAAPMFVYQVRPNTSEGWYTQIGDLDEYRIAKAHGISLRFLGKDVSNGFSSDAYLQDYILNNEPAVNALRQTGCGFLNQVLNAAWEAIGQTDWQQYAITFPAPIQGELEQYRAGLSYPQDIGEPGGRQNTNSRTRRALPQQQPQGQPGASASSDNDNRAWLRNPS